MNASQKPVAVVIGATSKWQSDGRNTRLIHGGDIDDSDVPVGVRWGVGGAIAQKFAQEGFLTVLTTRNAGNAAPLQAAIGEQGGESTIVELDLASRDSISNAFAQIREQAGEPDVLVYNAGYIEGRDLPPEKELLEHIPFEMFETAQHISSSGPFLVVQEVLPAMRGARRGHYSDFQQLVLAAWEKALHGTVAVLPEGADADTGAGSDRGILGARRACRQCGHRRHDRLTGDEGDAASAAEPRTAD